MQPATKRLDGSLTSFLPSSPQVGTVVDITDAVSAQAERRAADSPMREQGAYASRQPLTERYEALRMESLAVLAKLTADIRQAG